MKKNDESLDTECILIINSKKLTAVKKSFEEFIVIFLTIRSIHKKLGVYIL